MLVVGILLAASAVRKSCSESLNIFSLFCTFLVRYDYGSIQLSATDFGVGKSYWEIQK
ncbi:MAG: hypothetical protein F6K54_21870 [Okeania sp. SIO3B5]|uniref:hypothetical protein n=1 Tax=Okeania sp. SIO3B5 TaxID=2607811 RepID=UPI0013FFCDFA|nr:hypothetical protein [Okeania sp. SIO3B5]NEO55486.1 hypothetical protein [Okeania sp. SIO3B5]